MPAFNEEDTVAQVIQEIREHMDVDILVVNDGSRDRTSEIVHTISLHERFNIFGLRGCLLLGRHPLSLSIISILSRLVRHCHL